MSWTKFTPPPFILVTTPFLLIPPQIHYTPISDMRCGLGTIYMCTFTYVSDLYTSVACPRCIDSNRISFIFPTFPLSPIHPIAGTQLSHVFAIAPSTEFCLQTHDVNTCLHHGVLFTRRQKENPIAAASERWTRLYLCCRSLCNIWQMDYSKTCTDDELWLCGYSK